MSQLNFFECVSQNITQYLEPKNILNVVLLNKRIYADNIKFIYKHLSKRSYVIIKNEMFPLYYVFLKTNQKKIEKVNITSITMNDMKKFATLSKSMPNLNTICISHCNPPFELTSKKDIYINCELGGCRNVKVNGSHPKNSYRKSCNQDQ